MTQHLQSRPGVVCLADSLEKPLIDNRTYRVIRLPNELEALLIHDPETDKASASMDVNVGSFSDADDMPGMAHAVEHLLFMGTKKYPGENDYSQYLTKYGGNSNAYTAATSTNYYFELSASSTSNSQAAFLTTSQSSLAVPKAQAPLYGALDIFAQFFIRPLFLEGTLDRELKAMDSENKKNLQSDPWRLQQLTKSLSNKKHPFQKFSTGNYKVLHDDPIARGVEIRQAFIDFWEQHYSANRMKLAVLGSESLDTLQEWVVEHFSEVQNKKLPKLRWDDIPIYDSGQLGTQIFVKPVMEQRMLDIYFPYPDEEDLYESQPGRYISHLIGHEGPGSILAFLKAKGWANGLSSGMTPICPGTAFFSIDIRLTEDGLKHYEDIVKIIFQYIAMIKEQPPQRWIVEEMMKLAEVGFRYRQKAPASRTVSALSGIMQRPLPRDQLLSSSGGHDGLLRKFDPAAIKRGLDALTPENFRITVVSNEYPGDWNQKEKWYGTEYKYEKMPAEFMRAVEAAYHGSSSARPSDLHLPAKNEFIPQRLDIEKKEVAEPLVQPKLIRNEDNVRTWFKKDDRFWVPKANVEVCLRSPLVNATPLTVVLSQLYKELVEDSLVEYSYDAEIAGLDCGISNHAQGLDITVSGYNDKMAVLLEKVLVSMRDLEVKQERFDIIKDRMLRGFRNFDLMDPFRQISTFSRWLVSEKGWANFQLLEELPNVTAADVTAFFPQILRQMHIEVLVHGNLYKEDALRITDLISTTLNPRRLPQSQWPTKRSIILPVGADYRYERTLANKDNVNHCIEYVLFLGDSRDRPLRAKLLLLGQMTDEPCFDQLRTKEQLGYVVASGPLVLNTVAGYRVLIQSEKDCTYLEQRIEVFLTSFEQMLSEMSKKDFEEHKVSLINKRLESLKNLNQETARFWHHITSEAFDFELVYRDVENIEPLTKEQMLDFYRQHFSPASTTRTKATVYLNAQASAEDIAAKLSPIEQRSGLIEALHGMLSQLGVQTDQSDLTKRLAKVDVSGGDTTGIISAVGSYLKESAGMAAEQVEQVVQQGQAVLAQILPSLGIKARQAAGETGSVTNGDLAIITNDHAAATNGASEATLQHGKPGKTTVIQDVKAFKASMTLSAGPKPVKDLSAFEDLEPKL